MNIERLQNWKVAIGIFLLVTFLFTFPLFSLLKNWGMHDWDQHLFYEGAARRTILEFHQFPLWNPWQCGGSVLLANPQSPFLSIHFPLTLLLGEVVATKFAIMLYLFLGMIGMWFVCRKLNMGICTSYIPPVIVMLSGVYAIRMTVGHTNWFHLAWIPWIFFFYLKAKEELCYAIPAAFFLALIFLGGGIHPFLITVVVLGTYTLFVTIKEWKQCKATTIACLFLIFILWVPFAAIKLVPLLAVSGEMLPIEQTDIQPNSLTTIIEALTSRNPNFQKKTLYTVASDGEAVPWYWHEYYGYMGILPILLFFLALIFLWKRHGEYLVSVFFVLFFMLSQKFFPSLWKLAQNIPFASMFHGPSRFLFAAIFFMAVSIGFLCTHFENKQKKVLQWAILFIFFILFFDLTLVNSSLFKMGLYVAPEKELQKTDFYTVFAENRENFEQQYPMFLKNQGILNCYERFHVNSSVLSKMSTTSKEYGNYHGEAYIFETNKEQEITFFSPNNIIISLENKEGILVINQNYLSGWKIKIDGKKAVILNTAGLVSTKITKENSVVEFYYLPTAFLIGGSITLLTMMGGSVYFFLQKKKNV